MRSWRKNRESIGLEAELRANRPEPSTELVNRLEMRVRADGRSPRAGSFTLASVGGLGYAATGAGQAVSNAKRIAHVHGVTKLHRSAAHDQYSKPKKKKCGKGKKRVNGVCKKVKKARGVQFRRPPFTG